MSEAHSLSWPSIRSALGCSSGRAITGPTSLSPKGNHSAGRIAGETVDRRGKRCFVLTLQTREQHIRREKATSNVCTNQGLFALRATVYLSALGPYGLRELGESCLRKSHYAAQQLTRGERFSLAFDRPTFKEFVIRDSADAVDELIADGLEAGFFAGVPLGRWYPELADCLLVCVTEKRTRQEIDSLAAFAARHQPHQSMLHS
jgi:glycine dehydrogenase subunit 1